MGSNAPTTLLLAMSLGLAALAASNLTGTMNPSIDVDACAAGDPVACLASRLATEAESGLFEGVVIIGRDGEVAHAEGYGQSAAGEAYGADTEFDTAGLPGGMFMGVAIGQLLDEGKLSLDDRAGGHAPGLGPDVADATVAQLLSHTSGLGAVLEDGIVQDPGSFRYADAGYDVLAAIVETVSGMSYADYLAERVFGPTGMDDTFLTPLVQGAPPNGSGLETTTGPDLLRFTQALLADELLRPETTELFTSPSVETDSGNHYGFGFQVFGDPDGNHSFGHWGTFQDFIGLVDISEATGLTLIALCDRGCEAMGWSLIGFLDEAGIPY